MKSKFSEDIDITQSVIGHETLNAHSVEVLAAKSIGQLFSKANASSVKLSLGPLFKYISYIQHTLNLTNEQ